ncbi:MAG TPA: hypothetical protein VGD87_12015 [Archangium sp.]
MAVFSQDTQRRVRLRNAKKFDLTELIGERVVVHIGEMPQAQQSRVVAFLQMRGELLEAVNSLKPKEPSTEGSAPEGMAAVEPGAPPEAALLVSPAMRIGGDLAGKMLEVMRELISAAMLDEDGDRVSPADAAAFFDLLPATQESAQLLTSMSHAVLARLGKPAEKGPPPPGAQASGIELGK